MFGPVKEVLDLELCRKLKELGLLQEGGGWYWELYHKFLDAEAKLEKRMQKKFSLPLEFFYVDGNCVGIGIPSQPKQFPLIHDTELERRGVYNGI